MALKLRFDLMDLLNDSDLSSEKKRALSPFVKRTPIQREFGRRVINKIKDRTQSGKDKRNKTFVPNFYSKQYRESLEFRIHGKSSRPVTLKLTGEMQASIAVVKTDRTGVTIGFVSRAQDQKATGHVRGSGDLPQRDFWGLPVKDQVKILKGVIKDFNVAGAAEALQSALASVGQAGFDFRATADAITGAVGGTEIAIGEFAVDGEGF